MDELENIKAEFKPGLEKFKKYTLKVMGLFMDHHVRFCIDFDPEKYEGICKFDFYRHVETLYDMLNIYKNKIYEQNIERYLAMIVKINPYQFYDVIKEDIDNFVNNLYLAIPENEREEDKFKTIFKNRIYTTLL